MGSSLKDSDNITGTQFSKRDCQGTSNGIEDLSPSHHSEARLLSILSSHCRIEFSTAYVILAWGKINPKPYAGCMLVKMLKQGLREWLQPDSRQGRQTSPEILLLLLHLLQEFGHVLILAPSTLTTSLADTLLSKDCLIF